ncbi:MAG: 4a-hydroxytetrahydrobiopterin dehydratase [Flavobacterium sp.]|uniref:4a-hydroxytetrahydrobiopterin dehydratase n=1 Tax=Flavobacterium sp. TaxID=239 RepID=UPI0022C89DCA|nr:4a-hydroxytetrahydrobiopterin dehydratase [Flavobacterium sp.]MCZ8197588.1 4a-hydroxytetrahydrobiopterin dehydratase [Flavobacterium sp.]
MENINWETVNGKLVTNLKFKSQTELVEFLLKVAHLADEMNHHPDCKIHKAFQLEISLFTHDEEDITDLDYQLAEKIDSIITK